VLRVRRADRLVLMDVLVLVMMTATEATRTHSFALVQRRRDDL
jgi:hypothetical protein